MIRARLSVEHVGPHEIHSVASMRILIVGAAGKTGRELVRQAIERGYTVTAIAHHAPEPGLPPAVRLFIGDARDPALLEQAVAGQDFVVDAIGTRRPFVATPLETDVAHALLAAVERHRVSRIAAISSLVSARVSIT